MVGVRVLLGSQDVSRIPSSIEIFGRSLQVALTRSRWFDFPLTREESLQADKKLTITFGPSLDGGEINRLFSLFILNTVFEAYNSIFNLV
jgi:E3 ubiquitin-protein ligase UBR4